MKATTKIWWGVALLLIVGSAELAVWRADVLSQDAPPQRLPWEALYAGPPAAMNIVVTPPAMITCQQGEQAVVTAWVFDSAGVPVEDGTPVSFAVLESSGAAIPVEASTRLGAASSTIIRTATTIPPDSLQVIVTSGQAAASVDIRCGDPCLTRLSPPCPTPTPAPGGCVPSISPPQPISPPCLTPTPTPTPGGCVPSISPPQPVSPPCPTPTPTPTLPPGDCVPSISPPQPVSPPCPTPTPTPGDCVPSISPPQAVSPPCPTPTPTPGGCVPAISPPHTISPPCDAPTPLPPVCVATTSPPHPTAPTCTPTPTPDRCAPHPSPPDGNSTRCGPPPCEPSVSPPAPHGRPCPPPGPPGPPPSPPVACADVTGDGAVTGSDIAAIAGHMGQRLGDSPYDLDGDGVVGMRDVLIAVRQLGDRC